MSLGAIVYALRKSRGLSLADMEKITGINKGALSKFERDIEGLGIQNIDKLCRAFNTTASVLFAIAKSASKKPELLLDTTALRQIVKQLTRLIDNYLSVPEEIRFQIDKLLD